LVDDDSTRLHHILDACDEILDFTGNMTEKQFLKNRMLHLAVVHLLEIIGEAVNSISQKIKRKYTSIPWIDIVGMRNRLIHGYFDIDLNIVWQSIKIDIPFLRKEILNIVETENFNK
jgi:uncharacterized protein with HEPN domain